MTLKQLFKTMQEDVATSHQLSSSYLTAIYKAAQNEYCQDCLDCVPAKGKCDVHDDYQECDECHEPMVHPTFINKEESPYLWQCVNDKCSNARIMSKG